MIFDLRRVATMTRAAARLLAEDFRELAAFDVTAVLSGVERASEIWQAIGEWTDGIANLRDFHLLDDAIEWAEDQVVYRHGGSIDSAELTELSEQALLAGLTAEEIAASGKARNRENLAAGRAHHRGRGAGVLAVLSAKRRGPRQTARAASGSRR